MPSDPRDLKHDPATFDPRDPAKLSALKAYASTRPMDEDLSDEILALVAEVEGLRLEVDHEETARRGAEEEVQRLQTQFSLKDAEVLRLRAAAGVPTKCPSCGRMVVRTDNGTMSTWPPTKG